MITDWEKQILAYCIRISRGQVIRGNIKLSVFNEQEAHFLGGITVYKFLDIISYIARLEENLKDAVRRRGFNYTIEIGKNVANIIKDAGYNLYNLSNNHQVTLHDGFANEIRFCFTYEPHTAPLVVFEDIEVVDIGHHLDSHTNSLNSEEVDLESYIQKKFVQEFNFDDNTISFVESSALFEENIHEKDSLHIAENIKDKDNNIC